MSKLKTYKHGNAPVLDSCLPVALEAFHAAIGSEASWIPKSGSEANRIPNSGRLLFADLVLDCLLWRAL
jgi:hypothetical protein